jgi:hypothetical protein
MRSLGKLPELNFGAGCTKLRQIAREEDGDFLKELNMPVSEGFVTEAHRLFDRRDRIYPRRQLVDEICQLRYLLK